MKIQPALQTATYPFFIVLVTGKLATLCPGYGVSGWGGLKNKVFWDL